MEHEIAPELRERLEALLARQPEQSPLLQDFYTDPEIYQHDIQRFHLGRWLCAGHTSEIPEAGDWFRFDVALSLIHI